MAKGEEVTRKLSYSRGNTLKNYFQTPKNFGIDEPRVHVGILGEYNK